MLSEKRTMHSTNISVCEIRSKSGGHVAFTGTNSYIALICNMASKIYYNSKEKQSAIYLIFLLFAGKVQWYVKLTSVYSSSLHALVSEFSLPGLLSLRDTCLGFGAHDTTSPVFPNL